MEMTQHIISGDVRGRPKTKCWNTGVLKPKEINKSSSFRSFHGTELQVAMTHRSGVSETSQMSSLGSNSSEGSSGGHAASDILGIRGR